MQSDLSLASQALKKFDRLTHRYAVFHAAFFITFVLELMALLVFMLFFPKTMSAAIIVAATFLTVFVYFVLRFYLQTRKQEMLSLLRDQFLMAVDGSTEKMDRSWSAEMVYPIYQLIQKLQAKEHSFQKPASTFQPFTQLAGKFTVWCEWDDVHWMKETLHLHALKKILDWVKLYPTDLELHKTLAGAYTALYQIYQEPSVTISYSFITRKYESKEIKDRFEKAARSAAEEIKVVLAYQPDDAWALGQLARVYHDLGLRQEEKLTYETLLKLRPDDPEIHYQLGRLYFKLGYMAQGLHLYNELYSRQDPKAKELIEHYDAFHLI